MDPKTDKKDTGAKAPGKKDDLLLKPPAEPYKQRSVDGKQVIKETCPKAIQDAADYWFGKKTAEGRAADAAKKAGKELLRLMEDKKLTSVVVFNSEIGKKWRVNILQGEEKLKVEKSL